MIKKAYEYKQSDAGMIDVLGSDVTSQQGPSVDPTVDIDGEFQTAGSQTDVLDAPKTEPLSGKYEQPKKFPTFDSGSPEDEPENGQKSGTDDVLKYSWDTQGWEKANIQYQSDKLTSTTEYQQNRQALNKQAQQYQTEADMAPYVDAQNAEKVGWTGGYVLDQKRQTDYLKASIQAQLYGAMELQKYGYDSALAAARLSYDLNMKTYAQEYYKDAVSVALQEAQLTGTYVSAEFRDMISQYRTAVQSRDDESNTTEERERANSVISSIEGWLSANGVTKAAFEAMGNVLTSTQKTLERQEYEWKVYDAAVQAAKTDFESNPSWRFRFNEDGSIMIDDHGQAMTVDLDKMTVDELKDYVKIKQGEDSYYSYVKTKLVGTVQSGFQSWGKANGYITYDKDGNLNRIADAERLFGEYLADSDVLSQFADKLTQVDPKYQSTWKFQITLPDGTTMDRTYLELETLEQRGGKSKNGQTATGQNDQTVPGQSGTSDVLKGWKTYSWINGGTSPANDITSLRTLKVGNSDGKGDSESDRKELSGLVGWEMNYMNWLVKKGKAENDTLFWLESNTGKRECYLVLAHEGKYYLVSDDDNEQEGGKNDKLYNSYTGPKTKVSIVSSGGRYINRLQHNTDSQYIIATDGTNNDLTDAILGKKDPA